METDDPSSGEEDAVQGGEPGNPDSGNMPAIVGQESGASVVPRGVAPIHHTRRWIIGAAAALVVIVGVVVGVVISSTSTNITTGAGTATIAWVPVAGGANTIGNPPQPFTGTIKGISLSGIATTPLTGSDGKPFIATGRVPTKVQFFKWAGTFGGKSFNVGVYATYQRAVVLTNPAANPALAEPLVTIAGKWGDERVNGKVVTPTTAELKKGDAPIRFTGTVGDLKVTGEVAQPAGGGSHPSSTATFTLSK